MFFIIHFAIAKYHNCQLSTVNCQLARQSDKPELEMGVAFVVKKGYDSKKFREVFI